MEHGLIDSSIIHSDVRDPALHIMCFYYVSFAVEVCILGQRCIKCLGFIWTKCSSSMAWTKEDIIGYNFGSFAKRMSLFFGDFHTPNLLFYACSDYLINV